MNTASPRTATPVAIVPRPDLPARLAAVPGLVRTGVSTWDDRLRLPIGALSLENAYGDPELLRALGAAGADVARRLDVDVVVGAETSGIPLATATALAADRPFAFVRKPGYRGHETGEPQVRGADVARRRVLLVDDAVSSGSAVEAFVEQLARAGADVVGFFVLVDMRDVSESVSPVAAALPTESVSPYLGVLAAASANGSLDPHVRDLAVDALVNRWTDDDPPWDLLPHAA